MLNPKLKNPPPPCPLCRFEGALDLFVSEAHFAQAHYFSCQGCQLVYLNPKQRISPAAEKARYQLHDLGATDPNYLDYLSRLSQELNDRVLEGEQVLDFGSGQSSVIKTLLSEKAVLVAEFDPYFQNSAAVLKKEFYQHIVVCEAAEHFAEPNLEFSQLFSMCAPGGQIYVQTKILMDTNYFEGWHYRKDPTHISFFSRETMRWIAKKWQAREVCILGDELTIFKV